MKFKNMINKSYSMVFILLLLIFLSCKLLNLNSKKSDLSSSYQATITAVVDGDTVKIKFNNERPEGCKTNETVRLIGVNTPELNLNKNKEPEYFAEEAYEYTNQYWNKDIYIQFDDISSFRDKYSRLLAYVTLENGRLLNLELIEKGYGIYYDNFKFNNEKMKAFSKAEVKAKLSKKGLWK